MLFFYKYQSNIEGALRDADVFLRCWSDMCKVAAVFSGFIWSKPEPKSNSKLIRGFTN
jgi:hypothetical protein